MSVFTLPDIMALKFREVARFERSTLSDPPSVDRIDLSLNVLSRLALCCKVPSLKNGVRGRGLEFRPDDGRLGWMEPAAQPATWL
jgi:hypothetical protein